MRKNTQSRTSYSFQVGGSMSRAKGLKYGTMLKRFHLVGFEYALNCSFAPHTETHLAFVGSPQRNLKEGESQRTLELKASSCFESSLRDVFQSSLSINPRLVICTCTVCHQKFNSCIIASSKKTAKSFEIGRALCIGFSLKLHTVCKFFIIESRLVIYAFFVESKIIIITTFFMQSGFTGTLCCAFTPNH